MRRAALSCIVALACCGAAHASAIVGRQASKVRLAVSGGTVATVSYRAHGRSVHVAAWGAVNAFAPTTARRQVEFRLDYSGGSRSFGRPLWRAANGCRAYSGPQLPMLVAACTAPDGSYWAVQRWRRLVGAGAPTAAGVPELHLSHWTGAPASLVVKLDWAYRRYDHLYGWLSYRGRPVHGFHTTRSGAPLDAYGRVVYLDARDSSYGSGWHRVNGFVAQNPRGNFCWDFAQGQGRAYRATIVGPGVTPDVSWEGAAPGPFDPVLDAAANLEQRKLAAGSRYCRPN
jgi:hypothetical protein